MKLSHAYLSRSPFLIPTVCLSALLLSPAEAALTVKVLGTTATQALLTYQAPDNNPCTLVVSENSNLSPVIYDVDASKFNGANLDNRAGSLANGTTRVVIIGKRAAEKAQDGKFYSRALQNNTQHYYQISCGSNQGTGSFTTMGIPLGYTYNDPIPGDPNSPGNYAYPTMDPTNRNEEVVDPLTGLLIKHLTLPADKVSPTWSAAGFTDVCSPNMVPNESNVMGYHCLLGDPAQLYWINPNTGEARILGIMYPQPHLDMSNGNAFYTWNTNSQSSGFPAIEKRIYHGLNQASATPSQSIPICPNSGPSCIEVQVMTPLTSTGNIQAQFFGYMQQNNPDLTPDLFESYFGVGIQWLQQGKIMLAATLGIQNSMSWIGAFDPASGQMVAGMSTFHKGQRWCGLHTTYPVGDIPWFGVSGQNLWGTNQSTTTGNNLVPGAGPYLVHIAAAMTNQPGPCPANAFGVTGNQCTTIQVDGEPCNPTPFLGDNQLPTPESTSPKCANPSWGYAQDAQPGDVLYTWYENPASNGEYFRILVKNGTTWVVQRDYGNNFPQSHPAGDALVMSCGYVDTFFDRYWDFVDDPTGTNASGTTMPHDMTGTGGHSAYRPDAFVDQGYNIRVGPMPDVLSASPQYASDHPSFASVDPGTYDSEFTLESHPTYPYSNKWFLDGRPLVGGRSTNPPTATAAFVAGQLYKYKTTAYGAQGGDMPLSPQQVPTVASCGNHVLQDISGPTAAIAADNSSLYQYCLTRRPGECRPGSNAGDLYVNCPNRTSTTCIFPGWGNGGDGFEDMCIGNSEAYTMNLIQFGYSPLDNAGRQSRALTHGFVQYRKENVFWNVRALPDGSWMMFNLLNYPEYGPWAQMGFLAKLPPYTGYDGVPRNDLIQIPVQLTPPSGAAVDNAVIQFGYAEYGANNQYDCTSRHETCMKGSQPGRQYGYATDSIPGVSCASGCTVTIPAVPQHMVYFQALYRDASGNVIAKGTPQAVASEPPFLTAGSPLTVVLAAPASGLVTGTVPLTAAITGPASIAHVDFFVDNNLVGSTTTVPYTYNWDSTSVSSGYHTITVKAYDTSGNVAVSAPVTVTVTCNNIPSNSFQGCYYDDSNSTPGSFSQLLLSRTDPAVRFSWNSSPPSPLFPNYQYSVRWKGNVQFNADTYAFAISVNYNAQTRLWIDGNLVIDGWIPLSVSTGAVTFATAGTHLVQVDYANTNTNGWGSIALNWAAANGPQTPPIVPALNFTVVKSQNFIFPIYAIDPATTTLTYSITSRPQHGQASVYNPTLFIYTPSNYTGPDSITYKANDGVFDSNVATITFNVVASSQPILISPITSDAVDIDPATPGLQVYEGSSMLLSATASDAANNPIQWSWTYKVNGGPVSLLSSGAGPVQNVYFDVPVINSSATFQCVLNVQDSVGNSTGQTFSVGGIVPPSLIAPSPVTSDAGSFTVLVYPNPWRSDRAYPRQMTFAQLPAGTTVKIFTVSGHLVKTLDPQSPGFSTWDLTNDSGDRVASGIYIYLATTPSGNKARGKLAVIH